MKPDEIKLRLNKYASGLVDKIMPPTENMFDKLKNTGAKYWIKQNIWRLDSILYSFVDSNGDIDVYDLSNHFLDTLFDSNGKLTVDTKQLISEDNKTLSNLIPKKIVVFTRDDLFSIFGITEEEFKERVSSSCML